MPFGSVPLMQYYQQMQQLQLQFQAPVLPPNNPPVPPPLPLKQIFQARLTLDSGQGIGVRFLQCHTSAGARR